MMKKTLASVGMFLFVGVIAMVMFVASRYITNHPQFELHREICPYCVAVRWMY